MTRSRRSFDDAQKLAIVRRHLIDKVAISDLAEEYNLQPTQIYQWQRQLFDNGTTAFQRSSKKKKKDSRAEAIKDRKIAALEAKLKMKNEVVAELLEDHIKLKKELGEL